MFEKSNNVKNFTVFIIFLTSFILGVLFNAYTSYFKIIRPSSEIQSYTQDLDLTQFWQAYDLIKKEYFSIEWIKKEELVWGMITWLVNSLWDKHSEYMTLTEKKSFEETLAWDFEWIWAVVEKTEAWIIISVVIKDSPAKNSWLIAGDLITKANWEELKDKNLYDAVKLIKWPAWTNVLLTIQRVWEFKTFEKEVTRQKINIPSVQSKILDKENIWYIALNLFWDKTSEEFRQSLIEMKEKKVDGLIIDLRDNWGWYLLSAVEILSEFIEKGNVLVKTKYRDTLFNTAYNSLNTWDVFNKKIVVLINWNSASASEITSWALREYNKAILVWQKTYGKWSVQEPFDLKNGGLLKLTIAKWFTPKWKNIDKDWIIPDIEVILTQEDYEKVYDRQLEEAKKVLKDFIKYDALQLSVDKYKEENKVAKK